MRDERTFVRDERTFVREERTFLRDESTFVREERTFVRDEGMSREGRRHESREPTFRATVQTTVFNAQLYWRCLNSV